MALKFDNMHLRNNGIGVLVVGDVDAEFTNVLAEGNRTAFEFRSELSAFLRKYRLPPDTDPKELERIVQAIRAAPDPEARRQIVKASTLWKSALAVGADFAQIFQTL